MEENRYYDIEAVAEEFMLEMSELIELCEAYIIDTEEKFSEIDTLTHTNAWEEIEKLIHGIKGVSGNLRVNAVYNEAASFNEQLKQKNYENGMKRIETLKNIFQEEKNKIFDAINNVKNKK